MIGIGKWHVIEDKIAAEYCIKYKSIRMAHAMYLQDHPEAVSMMTGRPITFQALHSAAWRYIILHQEEGRKLLSDGYTLRGQVLDDETWKTLLASHSRTIFSKSRRLKFLKDNNLEAYANIRQERTIEGNG